jgi:hypothetical protein
VLENDDQLPSETVPFKTVQIIAAALVLGPLFFLVIAFLSTQGQPPGDPIVAYIGAGFAVVAVCGSLVASKIVGTVKVRQLQAGGSQPSNMDFFQVLQTRVIVRAAILEMAAFFNCIGYMTSRLWWSMATVLGLLAVMLILFPMRSGFDSWVRYQRELSGLDRGGGGFS